LYAATQIYLRAIPYREETLMPYCKKCGNELADDAKYCPACGTPTSAEEAPTASTVRVASTEPDMPGVKLAFWGERFVAWLLDAIILGIAVAILSLFSLIAGVTWSVWPSWIPFFNFNVGGVIYFLYWTLMDGLYGQSIGKMIMHIKVTRLDGSPIGIGPAALESVGKAFLLPLDFLLGLFLYPRKRQRIFNYLSETIVVRET